MTLKEKFDSLSCKDCDTPYCDVRCTMLTDYELNKLEKIADDYAIEFLIYEHKAFEGKIMNYEYAKSMLENFKKEKGL